MNYTVIVALVASGILGAVCGAVGSFSVLQKRALSSDVFAHSALPGIVIAFLLLGSKSTPVLLLGALGSGLLGIWVLAKIKSRTKTKDDASLALVLTTFFGAGIVLSRHAQNAVQDGSVAGLDSFLFGKATGLVMQDLILIAVIALLIGVILIVCFRQLKMTAFDPGYAISVGVPAGWLDRLLLAMTVGAVVAGLPMLGVVLVAALTIIPAITARFLTYRLNLMIMLSAGIGGLSAVIGVGLSAVFDGIPTGPTVILVAGSIFLLTLLFAKDHGIIAKAAQRRRLKQIAPVIAALRGQPANDVALKVMRKLDVGEPGFPNVNGLLLLRQWEEGSV